MRAGSAPAAALLCALLARPSAAGDLKFTVLAPDDSLGRCCPTPFFTRMIDTVKAQPGFTEKASEAQLVFVHFDTLRQCEWPKLRMRPENGVGCVDGAGDPLDDGSPDNGADRSCDWCCPQGTDIWLNTVQAAAKELTHNPTFVYFKNAQDTRFQCNEFDFAKLRTAELGIQVRFVGFQLQQSQMQSPVNEEDTIEYPIRGVNLLVPLTDEHKELPEDDEVREQCKDRNWLAYFSGMRSTGLRGDIFDLADTHDKMWINENAKFGDQDKMGYEDMLRDTVFALNPRGDEHYTFRLTEVLCAGAVPVMYDDDYYPPYASDDISEWAVVIPESKVSDTVNVITAIDNSTVCEMKRKGAKLCQYGREMQSVVDGMLTGLSKLVGEDSPSVAGLYAAQERRGISVGRSDTLAKGLRSLSVPFVGAALALALLAVAIHRSRRGSAGSANSRPTDERADGDGAGPLISPVHDTHWPPLTAFGQ